MFAWQATVQHEDGKAVVLPVVTVYEADGETLAAIYDSDGAAIGNPLIGTEEGFVQFWAHEGRYVIVGGDGTSVTNSWHIDLGGFPVYFPTRPDFVRAAAFAYPSSGDVVSAGGVNYIYSAGSTLISDLPGWAPDGEWTPLHWGAAGDGVTDDSAAVQAALSAYRTAITASPNQLGSFTFSGQGRQYLATESLDFTHVISWGWSIRDIVIRSSAVGKTALDIIGSRGGALIDVTIFGSEANPPRVGLQTARSAGGSQYEFCDHLKFESFKTRGFFTLAAAYVYGSECCQFTDSEFWNAHPDGHSFILSGVDVYPVESEFRTAITGPTSCINNQYNRCDFRHLPSSGYSTIVSAVMANPLQVTLTTAALFQVGDTVVFGEMTAPSELYNLKAVITAKSGNTITLGGVDASGWGPLSGNGVCAKSQTAVTFLLAGGLRGHTFNDCYVVNYGTNSMEIRRPASDLREFSNLHFNNILFEGYGSRSYVRWVPGNAPLNIRSFKISSYQSRPRDSIFSVDIAGINTMVWMRGAKIDFASRLAGTNIFLDVAARYAFLDADVFLWSAAAMVPSSVNMFTGKFASPDGVSSSLYVHKNLGYAGKMGLGGTATQLTSKSADVTLNGKTGFVVTHNETLAAGDSVVFRVLNSESTGLSCALAHVTGTSVSYVVNVVSVGAGQVVLRLTNIDTVPLSQAVAIRFFLLEGVND